MTAIDTENFREIAADLPAHMEIGSRIARNVEGLPARDRVENVVVLGMGDSAIAGDLLVATAAPFMAVPVIVVRSYELPAFVGEGSLVFAISYSGNTEEVVEAATEAAVQGAKVVCITSGGQLAELAGGWGAPVVHLPKDISAPRMAFATYAVPPIIVLEQIGLFTGASQWLDLALEQVRRRTAELQQAGSLAEKIAEQLAGRMVMVHGGGALGAAAAQRWKAQINQNAKTPAFWAVQPELCHNEVIGWEALDEVTRQNVAVVALRHDDEHPQVSRRFELVNERISPSVSTIIEVRAEGDGDLAQLFDLILIGDFVSLHLASQLSVDPGPVPYLAELKSALSQR